MLCPQLRRRCSSSSPHHQLLSSSSCTMMQQQQQQLVRRRLGGASRRRSRPRCAAAQPSRDPQQEGSPVPPREQQAAPAPAPPLVPQQQPASPPQQQQQPAASTPGGAPVAASSKQQPQPQAKKQRAPKQPPQPQPLLLRWLKALVSGLLRMQPTLIAFLLGGVASAALLYGWARGSPLRRHQPYRFTMSFSEASKVEAGTPVRMKGVQIGNVVAVKLTPSHIEAVAEVADATNLVPQGSRVDINLLGLAADPWIDISPPRDARVRPQHGPHHAACRTEGLIVCHNGAIAGHQGGSTDFMMKFFLSQHDRTRVKTTDTLYHGKQAAGDSLKFHGKTT